MSKLTLAMALRVPQNQTVNVSATATGRLVTLSRLFGSTSTFAVGAGTNANLQLDNGDGIKALAALGAGTSQVFWAQETAADGRQVLIKYTCTGAPVAPAVPAVTLTAGNGQISVAWVDGSNGGSPITSHRIYLNGSLVASPTGASPYVITGLTNGTSYSVQVSAVNSIDEGARSSSQSATPSAAPFASIDASGYTVSSPTPITPGTTFVANRAGFDSTGAPAVFADTLTIVGAMRSLAPSLTFTGATNYVLSEKIYASDSAGAPNNSTAVAPLGGAQWQQADRQIVGNTLGGSIIGGHMSARGGLPFACVIVTATDGNNTVSQTIAAPTLGPLGRDATGPQGAIRVWEYIYSLDISSLANGPITVNAKCYPLRGTAAAIKDSSTGTAGNPGFVPQIYKKDTTATNGVKNYVYVATGGNNSTGYVGTDPAAAAAAPVATLDGAFTRARAVLGTTTGALDGLCIRLTAGTWELQASPIGNTTTANVVIERDPTVPRASAIYQFGTANQSPGVTYLRVRDVKMVRAGANRIANNSVVLRDVDYDNGGQSLAFWNNIAYIEGGFTVTNPSSNCIMPAGGGIQLRQARGITIAGTALGSIITVEAQNLVGCYGQMLGPAFVGGRAAGYYDGCVIYSNILKKQGSTGDCINIDFNCTAPFIVQNEIEWCTGTGAGIGLSRDGGTANIVGAVLAYTTLAAANNAGRLNIDYDENASTKRTHLDNLVANNLLPQLNHKNGWFLYQTQALVDGRNGALETFNGVNFFSNFVMYVDAGPNQPWFRQDYPGLGSQIGTSSTVPLDPKFLNYQGITYNGSAYTAGTGGGDLRLAAGSPCRGAATRPILPGDILGNARNPAADTIGCYA